MIAWFTYIAILVPVLWLTGSLLHVFKKEKQGLVIISFGTLLLLSYIIFYWINVDRVPLKTLGETRLWYAFFVPMLGMIIYLRWKMFWMIIYSHFLAIIFLTVNLARPENFDKTLMPALQSVWFVPHVIVYIFSYALLGFSTLVAIRAIWMIRKNTYKQDLLVIADNTVYAGFAFLTFGLLFGALWAKEAWGHYWTWDPKETWAFLTWLLYLLYIHFRNRHKENIKTALWLLAFSFVILMICWFGINYLPSAQNSVHVYSGS